MLKIDVLVKGRVLLVMSNIHFLIPLINLNSLLVYTVFHILFCSFRPVFYYHGFHHSIMVTTVSAETA
jgi:hypothetical protein